MRLFLTASIFVAASVALSGCGGQESRTSPSGNANAAPSAARTIEERGRMAFSACAVCHSVKNPDEAGYASLVGPSLFGVYGARSGRIASYDYSAAMRAADLIWDDETLDRFLTRPQEVVRGTRMAFAGEADADRRAALIAYMKTLK